MKAPKLSATEIAKRQDRDITRIAARAGSLSNAFARFVRETALAAVKTRGVRGPLVPSEDVQAKLVDVMAFAYLSRIRLHNLRKRQGKALNLSAEQCEAIGTAALELAESKRVREKRREKLLRERRKETAAKKTAAREAEAAAEKKAKAAAARKARAAAKPKLPPTQVAVKKLAQSFTVDLGKLQNKFKTLTGRSLRRSLVPVRDAINRTIAKAIGEGLSDQEIGIRLLQRLNKMGIAPGSTAYLDTIIRTHSAIAYSGAAKIAYDADIDVWGYEYVTMRDDRVRPEHESLDGIKRAKDDAFWQEFWPPNGWNCRCQVAPIYNKVKQTRIPQAARPDKGFDFSPATLLQK